MFSLSGTRREVFNSRMNAAQSFRRRNMLFEGLMVIEQARNARLGRPESEPSFPDQLKAETLFAKLWNRGAIRAA